ncbi:MAG: tetrahydrofolate dehydrogenase/cyclohydrolase catalytic domain-containing protein, partial [Alphaproteobacteria bacterium]
MNAQIIDGKVIANNLLAELKNKLKKLKAETNIIPGLAILQVGNDSASDVYVRNKIRVSQEIGINSFKYQFSDDILTRNLITKIEYFLSDDTLDQVETYTYDSSDRLISFVRVFPTD